MERRPKQHGANRQRLEVEALRNDRHGYVVRIATHSDQERALIAFRSVREPVRSVAEDEFLVTGEHVEALRRAGVPFEDLTEPVVKNGKTAAG